MKKLASIALVGIVIVLATAGFGNAAVAHGGGFAGHAPSGHVQGRPGFNGHFEGRHFVGHRFDGRHFVGRFHGGPVIVAPFYWPYANAYPDTYDPAYTYQAPAPMYWYYCPSYGAYYPAVGSCPEAWVPVPSQ